MGKEVIIIWVLDLIGLGTYWSPNSNTYRLPVARQPTVALQRLRERLARGTEQLAKLRSLTVLSSPQNSDRDLAMVEAGGIMCENPGSPAQGVRTTCPHLTPSDISDKSCTAERRTLIRQKQEKKKKKKQNPQCFPKKQRSQTWRHMDMTPALWRGMQED